MVSGRTNGPVADGKQSIQRRRLLVVGKNLGGLTARSAFLESFGYQVVACSSHEQAVRSMQSEVFDFVLLNQGSRSLLVALDWGRRAPAKVTVARAPALKRRVSHHSPGQTRRDRLRLSGQHAGPDLPLTERGRRNAPEAVAPDAEIQFKGVPHEDCRITVKRIET
jgi:hypothetical protein